MFSDDDDDGYLFDGNYYEDYNNYFNYFSSDDDDYYFHHGYYGGLDSDYSDSDLAFGGHLVNEFGLSTSFFPDNKKLPIGCLGRVYEIYNDNPRDILKLRYDVNKAMEVNVFEQLLEIVSYVRLIMNIGQNRQTVQSEFEANLTVLSIFNNSVEVFEDVPSLHTDTMNNWYIWGKDVLIDKMEKLTSVNLPYTAWQSIISHLSDTGFTHQFNSKLGVLSEDESDQVFERSILRNCVLCCCQLFRLLYSVMYSRLMPGVLKKTRHTLPLLLNNFDNLMKQYHSFVEQLEPSCGVVKMLIPSVDDDTMDDEELLQDVLDDKEEINVAKLRGLPPKCQQNSNFLVVLIDADDPIPDDIEGNKIPMTSYSLLAVPKFEDESPDPLRFIRYTIKSDTIPSLFCSESLVASMVEVEEVQSIIVLDLSEPVEDRLLQTIPIKDIEQQMIDIKPVLKSYSITDITVRGVVKIKAAVRILLNVSFSTGEDTVECAYLDDYPLQGYLAKHSFRVCLPNIISLFVNAESVGMYNELIFIFHHDEKKLCVYDVNENGLFNSMTEIMFEDTRGWNLQIDYKSANKRCMLYKDNKIQLRNLDPNLDLVDEFEINTSDMIDIGSIDKLQYQLYDNVLYALFDTQPDFTELHKSWNLDNELDDLNIDHVEELQETVFHSMVSHFYVNLDSETKDLLYIDGDYMRIFEISSLDEGLSDIKFSCSTFSEQGNLVRLQIKISVDEMYGMDEYGMYASLSTFNLSSVLFYQSLSEQKKALSPTIENVIKMNKKELEENELKRQKLIELLRLQAEQREKMNELRKKQKEEQIENKRRKQKEKMEKSKKRTQEQIENRRRKQEVHSKKIYEQTLQCLTTAHSSNLPPSQDFVTKFSRLKHHIENKTEFTTKITSWVFAYGFCSVEVDGFAQDVFVHPGNLDPSCNSRLRQGTSIKFTLNWKSNKTRPQAESIVIV